MNGKGEEMWRWKQDDNETIIQVRDVYIDLIEEIRGVVDGGEVIQWEGRGSVEVEAKLPSNSYPRVGLRWRNGQMIRGKVGVHQKCERHI
jgi:hypothetical protein